MESALGHTRPLATINHRVEWPVEPSCCHLVIRAGVKIQHKYNLR